MKKRQILLRLSCGLSMQRCAAFQDGDAWHSTWALVKASGSAIAFGTVRGPALSRVLAADSLTRGERNAFLQFLGVIGKVQTGQAFVGWDWSYPSSPNADQFNKGKGCFTVHWRPVPAFNGCDMVTLGTCESGPDAEAFVALMEPKENGVLAFEPVAA
jgi:hypothetical protein